MDIRLDGVGHSYGDVEVMRDISLDIPSGKIVCVVGPSGCGKSTLLRFIGGLEQPTTGQILQMGAPPEDCLNPLTYVFQDFALLPWRSNSVVGQPSRPSALANRQPRAPAPSTCQSAGVTASTPRPGL